MTKHTKTICALLFAMINLMACTPQTLTQPSDLVFITAIPTIDQSNRDRLCAVADQEAQDWVATIQALKTLLASGMTCADGIATDSRLYKAYIAYGTLLEQQDRTDEAIGIYQEAYALNKLGTAAIARLERLQSAIVASVFEPCDTTIVQTALESVPTYAPSDGTFIRVRGNQLTLNGETFVMQGLNYYPRDTPFGRFLTETQQNVLEAELDIIQQAGFNTLRIFVRLQDVFICNGDGTIPNIDNLQRLDMIIQAIGKQGLRALVVLNQDPDLTTNPLYTNPPYLQKQLLYLVERYRNEPIILAWDLRDRGDIDYRNGAFTSEQVLTWLAQTTIAVRQTDPNHLITAGWWEDALATAPLVDFVSFQHYGEYEPLRQAIAILRDGTDKPIALTAIGYSTNALDETTQRNLIYQSLAEISNNQLSGWLVYMAFDYPTSVTCIPPNCPATISDINRFGVWNTSYFPKLTLEALERVMQGG
jgi:tetratricopeptide (TPR) repeat protein